MLRWRHILQRFLSQWCQLIYIFVKETLNLREEAVRYHDQTGGNSLASIIVTRISKEVRNET
jgi:hypothetical protein